VAALWLWGCARPTTLLVEVHDADLTPPASVTLSVFDDFGVIGRTRVEHPVLPGEMTVKGLPDVAEFVRVVAVADAPRVLDGLRFATEPRTLMTRELLLRQESDRDRDGVPDAIDDCPDVADPDQENRAGVGPGDACRGGPVADLAAAKDLAVAQDLGVAQDLAVAHDLGVVTDLSVADDLSMVIAGAYDLARPPADLAHADLAHADIDMAHSVVHDLGHEVHDLAHGRDMSHVVVADMAHGPDLASELSSDMSNVVIFSEGFENGIMGAIWNASEVNGSANTSPNLVHRGNYALHVHANALAAGAALQTELVETVAVPLPDLFIRVFAFVPGGSDPTSVAIVIADQTAAPHKGVQLALAQGSFATSDSVPSPTQTLSATTPMPSDRWVCLEWHLHVATGGYAKLYVDGVEVTALTASQNTLPNPTLGEVGIGLVAAPAGHATAARDVWFDDVIVDDSPIGCVK
jgi:hypothetical protein